MTVLLCWLDLDAAVRAVDDGVVETAVRLPVETLPQWWRACRSEKPIPATEACVDCVPVGPFPVTVAIATEVEPGPTRGDDGTDQWRYWDEFTSAIVAVGTLTEDGHHADECADVLTYPDGTQSLTHWCNDGLGPDTYHYALSDVVRLDTPIPAERECGTCGHHQSWHHLPVESHDGSCHHYGIGDELSCGCSSLSVWQVADADLVAQVRDATKETADEAR